VDDRGTRRVASLCGVVLAFLCLVGTVRANEIEPGLKVDYDPPHLSVEAREAGLGAVLRAIGAKVGFRVIESVASSRVVTLSIQNASVDDVLRQLLRAENHTVLYRAGGGPSAESGTIDRIVLLGDPSPATAAAIPAEGRAPDPGQGPGHRDASVATASLRPSPVLSAQSWPVSMPLLDPAPMDASDPEVPPVTVGDILKAHAMAAAQAVPVSTDQGDLAAGTPFPAASMPPLSDALAETTRRAQQALGALIDGLATATRSLQQSQSAGGK